MLIIGSKGELSGKSVNGEGSGGRKRRLSDEQVNVLENSFGSEQKPASERLEKLAVDLRRVEVWFQNRRARGKSQKLEEENNKLESQVLKVKEELKEAEKEIERLKLERCYGFARDVCNYVSEDNDNNPYFPGS
ncbi:hypothetical protein ACS0TY_034532 [Phlomoides rotata]